MLNRAWFLGRENYQVDSRQRSGNSCYCKSSCRAGVKISEFTCQYRLRNFCVYPRQVYVNKTIFSDPAFRQCQLSFVAFHFAITWVTLHLASRPIIGAFAPARTSVLGILPLTIAMGANVVLMNLSLAYSSVVFYQIVRILLTPLTALMNLFIYGSKIPFLAVMALLPACAGVGVVSYLEAVSKQDSASNNTSMLGVIFAFTGVAVSALYTVWVSAYYRKLKMTSSQLLLNQMPLGGLILAVSSYYTDKYPVWSEISREQWLMVGIVSLRPQFELDQY